MFTLLKNSYKYAKNKAEIKVSNMPSMSKRGMAPQTILVGLFVTFTMLGIFLPLIYAKITTMAADTSIPDEVSGLMPVAVLLTVLGIVLAYVKFRK